jgi:glycerol dehydrogenase-like iron-containing ADH family enzyme
MESLISLMVAPATVVRGGFALSESIAAIKNLGDRPLVLGGDRSLALVPVQELLRDDRLQTKVVNYHPDCCESSLALVMAALQEHQANSVIGIGGGKCLDLAKLVAHRAGIPVVTVPTTAATCAAWTALSNVYSEAGAFSYDVSLAVCPNLLVLDYGLIATAPPRTLVAGIGDAIAKWYEASVSSGASDRTLLIAAVQQARVLRDLLFQKSAAALAEVGSLVWQDVVDANVLLAGVIGGLGGAQCRTVAAHAVHNGLTHLPACHDMFHGEKVAFGILVQLRLEEMVAGNNLAASSRQQLLDFYRQIGLPCNLNDLGLAGATVADLQQACEIACQPQSDIHRLPFEVHPDQLLMAMVSTTVTTSTKV